MSALSKYVQPRTAADIRSIVRLARLDVVRLAQFEEELSTAETHEVYADVFESQNRLSDARLEARDAADAYRAAAYMIVPATALAATDIALGVAAVDLMLAAARAYRRGRSPKKASRADKIAANWAAFNERARQNIECADRDRCDRGSTGR